MLYLSLLAFVVSRSVTISAAKMPCSDRKFAPERKQGSFLLPNLACNQMTPDVSQQVGCRLSGKLDY